MKMNIATLRQKDTKYLYLLYKRQNYDYIIVRGASDYENKNLLFKSINQIS